MGLLLNVHSDSADAETQGRQGELPPVHRLFLDEHRVQAREERLPLREAKAAVAVAEEPAGVAGETPLLLPEGVSTSWFVWDAFECALSHEATHVVLGLSPAIAVPEGARPKSGMLLPR